MRSTPFFFLTLGLVLFASCAKETGQPGSTRIDSIIPNRARIGDTVTVYGKNFPQNFSITVNERNLDIAEKSDTRLKIVIPEKTGSGKLTLSVNGNVYIGPQLEYRYLVNVTTLAGTNAEGKQDGPGNTASFKCPWGLAFDQNENLLVADSYNRLIRTVDVKTGNVVTTVNPGNVSFYSPSNIAFDRSTGSIFVTDFNVHILKVDSNGLMTAFNFQNDIRTSTGIAIAPNGMVYFTDNSSGSLFQMNPSGENLTRISDAGITPRNLVFGPDGALYTSSSSLVRLTPFGSAHFLLQKAKFHGWEIAITPDGRFYQADHFSNRIQQVDPETGEVTVIAGTGQAEDVDGDGATAAFNGPTGIISDLEGNLYVSTYNFDTREGNNIRKITFR